MTDGEATTILTMVAAAYRSTTTKIGTDTVDLYRSAITPLDFELAKTAAESWIRHERFFPTIAEFMEAYGGARRARHAGQSRPEQRPIEPPPEWIFVWRWATDTERIPRDSTFPQFPRVEAELPLTGELTQPIDTLGNSRERHIIDETEYAVLHQAWVEAGSPHGDLFGFPEVGRPVESESEAEA